MDDVFLDEADHAQTEKAALTEKNMPKPYFLDELIQPDPKSNCIIKGDSHEESPTRKVDNVRVLKEKKSKGPISKLSRPSKPSRISLKTRKAGSGRTIEKKAFELLIAQKVKFLIS